MASKNSIDYYHHISEMSPIRAIAETALWNPRVRKVSVAECYELACRQPGVSVTDYEIYRPLARKLGLPDGAKILNDCHGKIVGRTAKARRFYNRVNELEQKKLEGDIREAVYCMEHHNLIRAEAVLGMDQDLMIKAHYLTTESDAMNVFNWLVNFTPFDSARDEYESSPPLPLLDIVIVAFNEWECPNSKSYHTVGAPQLALVDEKHNVIFNLGMRYFGERKKGTLTLAWTSGMKLGMAACHGGIKEIDFKGCKDEPEIRKLGKRSIAFYGLSGTGKSSHTNSHDNAGTLPEGIKKVVLHDDAFQIDIKNKVCRAWEPSLFDKTDKRDMHHRDWEFAISLMNHSLIAVDGRKIPVGLDVRQGNGRALFDRDLLGSWVNRCSFPSAIAWLMKDTTLPPIIKYTDNYLAVGMGASLITKRSRAENVSEEELEDLVFEPFANPFRVYELYKDIEAFLEVIRAGAVVYSFNSSGFWRNSGNDLEGIPLDYSLLLQTLVLTDRLEWEDWHYLPGAQIPTKESIDRWLPGSYDKYNPYNRKNKSDYIKLMNDRFQQRRNFLSSSDLRKLPGLLRDILSALHVEASLEENIENGEI